MSQREYRYDHDPRSSSDTGASVTPGKVTLTSRLQRREASAPPPQPAREAPTPAQHALQDQGLARAMGFVDEPPRVVQRAKVQRAWAEWFASRGARRTVMSGWEWRQ